jgi:hypothetical protein
MGKEPMRAREFITELQLPKNKWELLVSTSAKHEAGHELIDLVKTAYANTPQGSFVNSLKDVIPSDWNVIDWDKDPDIDSAIFYRISRPNESWTGYKIQGIGHDGARPSKDKAISKMTELLSRDGWWIESSDALRHIFKKNNLAPVTDEDLLKRLFSDPKLKMIDVDTYRRQLEGGVYITETVFGKPKLKGNI